MNHRRRSKLKPSASFAAIADTIARLSASVRRSSGSSFIVHGAAIGSSRSAKFHWSPKPLNARCTTWTPWLKRDVHGAIGAVAVDQEDLLRPTFRFRRTASMLCASFSAIITTATGAVPGFQPGPRGTSGINPASPMTAPPHRRAPSDTPLPFAAPLSPSRNRAPSTRAPFAPFRRAVLRATTSRHRAPQSVPAHRGRPTSRSPRFSRPDQGAPLLTTAGHPCASASATVMPKFSERLGSTNRSASR